MCTPGFEREFKMSVSVAFRKHAPVCNRGLGIKLSDSHFFTVGFVPADGSIDGTFAFAHFSGDYRLVPAHKGMLCYLQGKPAVGFIRLGDNEQSGCVLIDPVNDPRPHHAVYGGKPPPAMKKQRVDKRSVRVAGRGVDNHSARFIAHEKVFVLVKYIHRNILRCRGKLRRRRDIRGDRIVFAHRVFLFRLFTVYRYKACGNKLCSACTAHAEVQCAIRIQPFAGVGSRNAGKLRRGEFLIHRRYRPLPRPFAVLTPQGGVPPSVRRRLYIPRAAPHRRL